MNSPAPDSRVSKMATFHAGHNDPDDHDDFVAKCAIRDTESAGLVLLDPSSEALRKRLALTLDIHATIYIQPSSEGAIYECGCNADGLLGSLVGEDAVSAHIVDRLLAALAAPGGE